MRSLPTTIVLLIGLLAGCAGPAAKQKYRRPQMTAEELKRYYDYPHGAIEARSQARETTRVWSHQLVELQLQLPADMRDESVARARRLAAETTSKRRLANLSLEYTVRFDYFRPNQPGPHPLVILSPILGGNMIFVEDFARYFAANGFCAAVVHRKRTSIGPADGLDKIEHDLRKSVLRVRQALDWALQQPEVDPSRVASFGISYGAIINTIVAGAEPRIRYHIFALGGGDLPNIIMSTTEPQIRRQVAKVARARGWTPEQLRDELDRTLKSDPINSAPVLEPDNVLMVVAQFDAVVGTQYENLLWRRLRKPERIVVPLGHATSALALPFIKGEALVFLQRRFGLPVKEIVPPNRQSHSSKRY